MLPLAPLLPALADFSPDFAAELAPALFFACVSLAVFFLVATLGEFAASSESGFLGGVFFVFGDGLLIGEDFGTVFRVDRDKGFGVGLGVAAGVAIGSWISLFATGCGSSSIFSGGLLTVGIGSGVGSDFS